MKILNTPFFRSSAGRFFIWTHMYVALLLATAAVLALMEMNGWPAVRLALWTEVIFYLICLILYRGEIWLAGRVDDKD